ncbi:MAG: hypothetical protein NC123_15020 [Butyrivibrio sp.]|nr:hypothetical protein [Butyrivibrio sp.]
MKRAIIYWFSEAEGGRKKPPTGTEYYPTIVLENGSTWSLAIRFDRKNPTQNEMADDCEVCFLFEDAPHHLLSSNAEFIIYEGSHKVGAIVIR